MEDLVSVVMPIYFPNQNHFEKAIESLLEQSYDNIEIIIVSDGHEKELEDYLDQFKNPQLRLMKNPKRLGLIGSLNLGIKESRGNLIARLDSDDISLRERIEKQKHAMDMNPNLGMVGSNAIIIGYDDQPLGHRTYPETYSELRNTILSFCPFAHSSVMIRKEVLHKVGDYNPTFAAEDYDLWIRIARQFECINLHESLVKVRRSSTSITGKRQKWLLFSMLCIKTKGIASRNFPISYVTIISSIFTLIALFVPRAIALRLVKSLDKMGYYEAHVDKRIL